MFTHNKVPANVDVCYAVIVRHLRDYLIEYKHIDSSEHLYVYHVNYVLDIYLFTVLKNFIYVV